MHLLRKWLEILIPFWWFELQRDWSLSGHIFSKIAENIDDYCWKAIKILMNSHQYFLKKKKETRIEISEILTFLLPYHLPKTNLIK